MGATPLRLVQGAFGWAGEGERAIKKSLNREEDGMQNFQHCPNCHAKGGTFTFRNIYACEGCEKVFCDKRGPERCPSCGSKHRKKVGEAH
jgi:rubrerythrin